jgi:hypothetical protein
MVQRIITMETRDGWTIQGNADEVFAMTDYRNIAEDPGADAPIATPIEAKGTITKSQVILVIMQIIPALGAVIALMGFGEADWIVKLYRFLQSQPALPIIGAVAWVISTGWYWVRNKKRAIERAVMAALVSNKVGKVVGPVSPVVQAAIDEAVKAQCEQATDAGLK